MKMEFPFSCLQGLDIIVYGTGLTGSVVIPYLLSGEETGFCLQGATNSWVESAGCYKNTALPLRSIAEWRLLLPDATILIATSDLHHGEIKEICQANGFHRIIPLTPAMKDTANVGFFRRYLKERGISTDGDTLCLGDMILINPFRCRRNVAGDFFSTFVDLILPPVFHDWDHMVEGPYEYGPVKLSPGDIVLDCGANVGIFSAYAAARGCTCYAFEPTPSLIPFLQRHSELNGGRIIPVEAALSDRTGSASLYLSQFSHIENSLLERLPNMAELTVPQITVDEFVRQQRLPRVDFIKADIEGAERLMLAGAQKTLALHAPEISVCTYHLPDDREVLTALILKANPSYRIEYTRKKLYAHVV